MPQSSSHLKFSQRSRLHPRRRSGFSIAEAMVAFSILILVICGSMLTMNRGMQTVDFARCSTLASQLLQSRMETLRLKNWTDMQTLRTTDTGQGAGVASVPISDLLAKDYDTSAVARFAPNITQVVADDSMTGRTDVYEIKLSVTWIGLDRQAHTRSYSMLYAKDGLYDYYCTSRS